MRSLSLISMAKPPAEMGTDSSVGAADSPDRVFLDLRRFLEQTCDLLETSATFEWKDLEDLVERVARCLDSGEELFWSAHNTTLEGGDYIAFHGAQLAVLTMRIGMTNGYDHRRLVELGMAAALCDIGLWPLPPRLLRRLDALTPDERAEYEAHPRLGAERLRRSAPPVAGLVETVLQHHERAHGQGFPQGLPGASIRADAEIIGLVDTYLGLTAPAPPRARRRPYDAIHEIFRTKLAAFPAALIKALLNEISVFPPGTTVRLSTGEVGTVVGVNRNHPLRPRVEIVRGKSGPLERPKIVDLSQAPFLHITDPVFQAS